VLPKPLLASRWREFPYRGELRELIIAGSGRERVLQGRLPSGGAFAIALYYASTTIRATSGIIVTTSTIDDNALEVCYRAEPGFTMRLVQATLDYPGSDEDWEGDCRRWRKLDKAPWPPSGSFAVPAIDLELAAAST